MALYAFDGTNKRRRDVGGSDWRQRDTTESNVSRFFEAYRGAELANNGVVRSWYREGVGYTIPWPVLWILLWLPGVLFGAGAKIRLRAAYRRLCHNWHVLGDRNIDIVGFSRGAALALAFANVIEHHGIRNPADRRDLSLWRHKGLGWVFRHPPKSSDTEYPRIRFLGLWDVVGSFGMPINPFGIDFQGMNIGLDLSLSSIVDHCFHAMALDETRRTFRPTRVKGAVEVWFRGVHSNVGGGFERRGLSDIALSWMFDQASECGLILDTEATEVLRTDLENKSEFELGRNLHLQVGWIREVRPDDLVHWTAYERKPLLPSDRKKRLNLLALMPIYFSERKKRLKPDRKKRLNLLAPIPYNAKRYEHGAPDRSDD